MDQSVQATSSTATGHLGAEITIVLPTYNERANIAPMVERLDRALSGMRWEVIVVDDNSPDGTAEEVRTIGARDARVHCLRRVHRRGRASACIEGMLAAQGRFVAVMDADLQHDEAALPRMIELLRADAADIVVGTRYVEGGSTAGLAGVRLTISRSAGVLARLTLGVSLSDPTSGFFAARRDVIERLAPELATDGFNTLLDIVATRRMRLRIAEVPYVFRSRVHGESKLDARIALDFAALLVSRLTYNLVPQRFLLFCIVGVSGIVVHLVALTLFRSLSVPFDSAQALAALIAIASNFWLNNVLTYRDQTLRGLAAFRGLVVYALICGFGFVSNISVADWMFTNQSTWWVAGLTGAIVSAVWNYAISATIVWRR
jgi:dolichol-phosphate mannosyltransferase